MNVETMTDLYIAELQDLLSAEKQLVKALPKMAKGASSSGLSAAFRDHLEQTKEHVTRLETVLKGAGAKPGGETCEAMEGLVREGEEVLDAEGDDDVRNAGIIVAAQKVEHYEIAGYGSVCTFAKQLGRKSDARLLHKTLEEERAADELLTRLAESEINLEAAT